MVRKQKGEGESLARAFLGLACMGKAKQSRGNSLGLPFVNSVGGYGLQGWSRVVSYLTLGDLGHGKCWLGV